MRATCRIVDTETAHSHAVVLAEMTNAPMGTAVRRLISLAEQQRASYRNLIHTPSASTALMVYLCISLE